MTRRWVVREGEARTIADVLAAMGEDARCATSRTPQATRPPREPIR